MAGIIGEFFLVSVSHETEHEKSSKIPGKIRRIIRGKIPGTEFEKFGELSFCNFSNPTKKWCGNRTGTGNRDLFFHQLLRAQHSRYQSYRFIKSSAG